MRRLPNLGYPAPVFRPALSLSPPSEYARLQTSPNAVRIEWYQALSNPSYDPATAVYDAAQNEDQYIRTLMPGEWWAIVGGERAFRRYFPQGSWETGDIILAYNESSLALSVHDWILPFGNQTAPAGQNDARTFQQKETAVRSGGPIVLGVGTLTSVSTAVTGSGTSFLSALRAGDIINVAGAQYLVRSVTDNTHLVLASPPVTDWAAIAWSKSTDVLLYNPIARVVTVLDASTVYVNGTDFVTYGGFAKNEFYGGVQWINPLHCPAAGARYSVLYEYYPTYIIGELGLHDQILGGLPGLAVMTAKLVKPDTNKR